MSAITSTQFLWNRAHPFIDEYFDQYILILQPKSTNEPLGIFCKNLDIRNILNGISSGLDTITRYLDDIESGKIDPEFQPRILSQDFSECSLDDQLDKLLPTLAHNYLLIAPKMADTADFTKTTVIFPELTKATWLLVHALTHIQKTGADNIMDNFQLV
jgi:hypothetical protein